MDTWLATTGMEYAVSRDGEEIGRVRVRGAVGMLNRGEDPRDWIARRPSEVEEHEGTAKLASALRAILQL